MISFDPEQHKYTNTETNETYISATTVLGLYKPKFDAKKHAERISKRDGVPVETILETWEAIAKKATDKGSLVHKMLEDYTLTQKRDERLPWLFDEFDRLVGQTVEKYMIVHAEKLLWSHDYKVAGTADLIFDQGNYFSVGDFKTNKAFKYESKYNEYLSTPLDHLAVCEFNSYALQLSLYAYMYEMLTGKKCKRLFVLYLRADRKSFDVIHLNYLKAEVQQLLENYRLNLEVQNSTNN